MSSFAASLEVGEPFQRYIHQEELYGYSYPLKASTVPSSTVFAMVTLLPSGVILLLWSFHRDKREMARRAPPRQSPPCSPGAASAQCVRSRD